MKQSIFMLYILIMLLTGCASISTKQLISIAENKQAVVLGSCYLARSFTLCDATWRNEQNQTQVTFGIKSQVQVLEPGTYSLSGFISDKGWFPTVVRSIANLRNIASFSIKGGDVLYIGNLEFDISKSFSIHHAINVIDNKNSAEQYLSKYQPKLLPRLQTRLIQLSPEVLAIKKSVE
ncbi:MAG TPA: hypothetical protein LFW13_02535 [Rickettsia endosymbiont of Sericostoma sp.]|jgi:hypothetical protein|uniref:hypothetical protein n=1 Tax=unclassified Candidatus Tisiphia TaxID=2996318 RepID=UPI001DDE5685|nr:hypothetical protein [Rickettsia endosymbiont of Sericostoma sp.]